MMKNRKGSMMVEAAITFPLVILALMVVIYILIFLTRQVVVQSEMHMELRAEAGVGTDISETCYRKDVPFSISETKLGYIKEYQYDGVLRFSKRGLLTGDRSKNLKGSVCSEREVDFIRRMDLISD